MARIRIEDLPAAEGLTAEQEELIQGAGLKSFRPTLEGLEDRQLMASHLAGALPVPAPAPDPAHLSVRQLTSAPPVDAGMHTQPPAGQDHDIFYDRRDIALKAKARFEEYVIRNGSNPWAVRMVTSLSFGETTDKTVTVYLDFKYGSSDNYNDLKTGRVQLDFTRQGFRVDFGEQGFGLVWSRHYDATSISLHRYDGAQGGELAETIKEGFQSGIDVRQSTPPTTPATAPVDSTDLAGQFAPGGNHGAGALMQGPQYDVSQDGDRICKLARDAFMDRFHHKLNVWGIQNVTGATWQKTDDITIRVTIKFNYGLGTIGGVHNGQIQINFCDRGFHAGWWRAYEAVSTGLQVGVGNFAGMDELVRKDMFNDGLKALQSTVDVPSYVAAPVTGKFDEIMYEGMFFNFTNRWGITSVTNVACRYEDGYLKVRLSFSYVSASSSDSQGYLDLFFTKEGDDHGGPQVWKVVRTELSRLEWGDIGLIPHDPTRRGLLLDRIGEVYGKFQVQVSATPPATAPTTGAGAGGQLAPGGDHGHRPTGAPQGDPAAPQARATAETVLDPVAVRLGQFTPGGDHGVGTRLMQGEQYDVSKDGNSIRDQARDLFKQKVIGIGNVWMVQNVSSVTWEQPDGNTIRVTIHFKYGSSKWFNDIHDGRVQINFVDKGFHAGWYRHYDAASVGLYGYEGLGGLDKKVLDEFKAGIDVRQSTLDLPSYVAEKVKPMFEKEMIGGGRWDNGWFLQRVASVESGWANGNHDQFMVRINFIHGRYTDDHSSSVTLLFKRDGQFSSFQGIDSETQQTEKFGWQFTEAIKDTYKDFRVQVPATPPATAPVDGAVPVGQLAPGGDGHRRTGAPQADPVAPQAPAHAETAGLTSVATQARPDTLAVDALFADLARHQREQA
jgi:hypothetical protein